MSKTKRRSIDAIISEALVKGDEHFQKKFALHLSAASLNQKKHVHQLKWKEWQAALESCLADQEKRKIKIDDSDLVL